MGEINLRFQKVVLSEEEKDLENSKNFFFSSDEKNHKVHKLFTYKNINKSGRTFLEILGVLIIPFISSIMELYYVCSSNFNTMGLFLNFIRVNYPENFSHSRKKFLSIFQIFLCMGLNLSCFFLIISNILINDDRSLDDYLNNGVKFVFLTEFIYLFFYFTSKIRPLNQKFDHQGHFKNELNMNFIQNMEFLGVFSDNEEIPHFERKIYIYKVDEILEETFEKNSEMMTQQKKGMARFLIGLLCIVNATNEGFVLIEYGLREEMSFYRFFALYNYSVIINFLFSGLFVFLFMDYTFSKKIHTNQCLLEMIKYQNTKSLNKQKKKKRFPTMNFLDEDNLFLWNRLRKWNLKKNCEKKNLVIDFFIIMITFFVLFLWIIILIKIFSGKNVLFDMNMSFIVSVFLHSLSLDSIILWKLFQGAYANSYFSKFEQQLLQLLEDFKFLKYNIRKIEFLDRNNNLTKKELFFKILCYVLSPKKDDFNENEMKKKIKGCEKMIILILKEINLDETINQIKFLLIIPMNFTLLKSVGISLITLILTITKLIAQ